MLYKVKDTANIPEDMKKNKNLLISKASIYSTYMLACGIIGFIIGFFTAVIGI